ncbi:MAG: hypothetical protein WAT84_01245 [Candidatus Moraniibacteriota bacterium]
MIFGLVRLLIWLAGMAVVVYFALTFMGYSVNWEYFSDRKAVCEKVLRQCQNDLVKTGLEGAKEKCQWQCFDLELLIHKK